MQTKPVKMDLARMKELYGYAVFDGSWKDGFVLELFNHVAYVEKENKSLLKQLEAHKLTNTSKKDISTNSRGQTQVDIEKMTDNDVYIDMSKPKGKRRVGPLFDVT